MKQITQLFQAEELVGTYIQKYMRSPRLESLKERSPKDLTYIAIEAIDRMILQKRNIDKNSTWLQFPIAPIACEIGKNIMIKQEKDFKSTKERNFTYFKAGWAILSALGTHNDLTIRTLEEPGVFTKQTKDKFGKLKFVELEIMEKNTYLVIRNVELFTKLAMFIPMVSETVQLACKPSLTRPKDWTSFYHPVVGELASKCTRRVKRMINRNSNPRLFKMINKQQGTAYRVNKELRDVLGDLREHDMFTLAHLDLDDDQFDAKFGELEDAMKISGDLYDAYEFYEYRKLCFRARTYSRLHGFKTDGCSLGKAMYQLKHGKKIGEKGWRWMMIHAANCFGEDKITLDERYKFAEDNLDLWMKWADDPKNYADDWFKADNHFEFIAILIDIKNALLEDNKYDYVSHNAVYLDATCSGLMILALLTRDEVAGKETNLIESIVRGDAYANIAQTVKLKFKDTKQGKEIFERLADKMELIDFNIKAAKALDRPKMIQEANDAKRVFLEEHVAEIVIAAKWYWSRFSDKQLRALCKTPVMCIPYSAGAATNSASLLADFKPKAEYAGLNSFYCDYLSEQITIAFAVKFPRVAKLMTRFQERCKDMGANNQNYGFTVPFTNFEFEQEYRDNLTQQVKATFKGKLFRPRIIVAKKQMMNQRNALNAASPNSVHCIDAALLCYIVIFCNFDVIAIHDSVGCLPSDAEQLYYRTRKCLEVMFKDEKMLEEKLHIDNFELGELEPNPMKNEFVFS